MPTHNTPPLHPVELTLSHNWASHLRQQTVKAFAVIMLGKMTQLMQNNVVNALAWGFHQMRVKR